MEKMVRTASFVDKDGQAMIINCNLIPDPKTLAPIWPLHFQLGGRTFKFLKEGLSGRPIYKEMTENTEPSFEELSNEDKIAKLKAVIASQNNVIIRLNKEIKKLLGEI